MFRLYLMFVPSENDLLDRTVFSLHIALFKRTFTFMSGRINQIIYSEMFFVHIPW